MDHFISHFINKMQKRNYVKNKLIKEKFFTKDIIFVVNSTIVVIIDAQNAMLFVRKNMDTLVSMLLASIGIRKNNNLRYSKKMLKGAKAIL